MTKENKIVVALPKGRILKELQPLFDKVGIRPEDEFFDENSRKLAFATNDPDITFIRVRSFDVPTFVAFGAAQMGISGNDVLMEFDYPDIYAPLDLQIGICRLSVAAPQEWAGDDEFLKASHIRIATKYPNITKKYFAEKGVQAECIKLNGAMELAPKMGLCRRIVDLVSTGATLKANGLVETEKIADISSRLIVNRGAFKTKSEAVEKLVGKLTEAVSG